MKTFVIMLCVICITGMSVLLSDLWAQQCRQCNPTEAATEGGVQDGVLVRETFKVHQNKFDIATDLHFKLWQKEDNIYVNGWRVCISHFDNATSQRGDQPEPEHSRVKNMPNLPPTNDPDNGQHAVDVEATGNVPRCTQVKVYSCFWLTDYNTKRLADIEWTFEEEEEQAAPGFGWSVGWPKPVGAGDFQHLILFSNDDPRSHLILRDLKFHPTMDFVDSLESITFSVQLPDTVSLGPGQTWAYSLQTAGDLVGGHVYGYFKIGSAKGTEVEWEEWFDHPVTDLPTYDCPETIHKTEPGLASDLHVAYSGVEGSIRDVILLSNPPGCPDPVIQVVGGNWIYFDWGERCVDSCEVVEYQYTADYPCQPPVVVDWTYDGLPTLSQWVLIILALSVAALFVWQLMRRRKAAASV